MNIVDNETCKLPSFLKQNVPSVAEEAVLNKYRKGWMAIYSWTMSPDITVSDIAMMMMVELAAADTRPYILIRLMRIINTMETAIKTEELTTYLEAIDVG